MLHYVYNGYTGDWQVVDPQDPFYQDCDWESQKDWFGDDCMICLDMQLDRYGNLVVAE